MAQSTSSAFEGVLDRYFESYLSAHPTAASHAGLRWADGKLGRAGLAFEIAQEKLRRRTLQALEQIAPNELQPEQQLDRLALRSSLLRESENFALRRHALEPAALERVLDALFFELRRAEEDPKRSAANLRSLLRQTPNYLDAAASLLEHPETVWRKVMEELAAGVPSLFRALESFLQRKPHKEDSALLAAAQTSCKNYCEFVQSRKAAPENSFAIGPELLARRVHDELGLDWTLGQIESVALREIERLKQLLAQACRPFGRNRSPEEILEEGRRDWHPGSDLVGVYRDETARLAQLFRKFKAVTFPQGESLEIRLVPEFMRPLFPIAAYTVPGPFEKKQQGIFWVNDLSAAQTSETAKRRERAQHFGLALTCVHEAYPGHHLQFAIANQHPRRWRRMFAHAIFYEGWTLWCEQMFVDLGIERSPWSLIQQRHDALWRCHRILVDVRLQTRRYTYAQAVRHLQRHLGFTRARAEADVNWYTGQPAVPMSYWLGRLENERLRQKLMVKRGWSLRQFNDWLLSFGTIPQSWIEKYGLE